MIEHDLAGTAPLWSTESTSALLAELIRRQEEGERPACGSAQGGDYNTPAHVGALVLILVLSIAGCGFPLISQRANKHKGPNDLVFYSQHFGTGVLIATAFVHLLPTAFVSLTHPCLPWFFNQGYRPLAGVIAMISALVVVGLEMFLRTRGVAHTHSHVEMWEPETTAIPQLGEADQDREYEESSVGLMGAGSWSGEPSPKENDNKTSDYRGDAEDSDLDLDELDPATGTNGRTGSRTHGQSLSPEEIQKKLMVQCMLLEAGIIFHSVFIGMAVSVATGPPFVVFLIAISFHQTFEGMALGSRIAAIKFPKGSLKPWLMVLAYGLTTPIGQAIGLAVHTLYDPKSQGGLLMVGVMNAISSGLLLFAGLVQLLAEDFLSEGSYGVLQGKKRVQAFTAVILGATLMALVGAFA
ncbi:hypothetical protein V502_10675 [Pseudogymnoascus sp. VKM F-4520 (FW-2644)]|nr:hypothetical protein V502_10675 [Pseudogymnoascus sp. VKM F-4520 (FW-2644)]